MSSDHHSNGLKDNLIIACYVVLGAALFAASLWVTVIRPKPPYWQERAAHQAALPVPNRPAPIHKVPPEPRSTGERITLDQWVRKGEREVYCINMRPYATVFGGQYFWDNAFSVFQLPVGLAVFKKIPFYLDESGAALVLPTDQDPILQRKPPTYVIRFQQPLEGVEYAFFLGLIAGWGGEISDAGGPSAIISFSYAGQEQRDAFKLYCCDIWEYAHQKRKKEEENVKVLTVEGIHIDMRAFPLRTNAPLEAITIDDANAVDSPLILAITLTRPAAAKANP